MIKFILDKIIGNQNERELKRYQKDVLLINELESGVSKLSNEELRAKTDEFRKKIKDKEKEFQSELEDLENRFINATSEERSKVSSKLRAVRNKIFSEILHEAFAVVRETAKRTVNMRHFDVQLVGGMVLHEGRIAEMTTGEGKTLVATLPAYVNALLGRGVHIVTVNDYLARRDCEWMGPVFETLGLSVGVIQHDMSDSQRREAYRCDITYGTNNEFGFDYLRDNMKMRKEDLVQRPFYFAVVDEVDSILIDEARTPLIISGPTEDSTDKYYIINKIIPKLKGRIILEKDEIDAKSKGIDLSLGYDYVVDEKSHTADLSEEGEAKVCSLLGIDNLHDVQTMDWRHHIIQAIRAHKLFKRDVDYVVKDGKVIIVDEFTGRLMPGRRWSSGQHQAVEAKEGLRIEHESQTFATITLQNYFRMYERLAGMTGTAFTEASEFKHIYDLDVVVIPTNKQLIRTNYPDSVYKTEKEKFDAVVREIEELNKIGRPVLVGTISIEKSELLSGMLKRRGISHNVLNAKYHESEAQIVAQAGRYKSVTIATNMAGRGTDILLGGNAEFLARSFVKKDKVKADSADTSDQDQEYKQALERLRQETKNEHEMVVKAGGLHIIGTERHESRRIDNQLRGRSGRQGDPGSSRFYVSFEDDLMRLFAPDWILKMLDGLDTGGESLTLGEGRLAGMFSRSIEVAQKRVENHNFDIRKHLLEFDNVMNQQREIIYQQRSQILKNTDLSNQVLDMFDDCLLEEVEPYFPNQSTQEEWDIKGLVNLINLKFGVKLEIKAEDFNDKTELIEYISKKLLEILKQKEDTIGSDLMRYLERMIILQVTDKKWKEHLYEMDILQYGIGLRAHGQRDPLIEYKREGFIMFQDMISFIKREVVGMLFRIQPAKEERFKAVFADLPQETIHKEMSSLKQPASGTRKKDSADATPPESKSKQVIRQGRKVGRNDPCPCGSGKKYKKCCAK